MASGVSSFDPGEENSMLWRLRLNAALVIGLIRILLSDLNVSSACMHACVLCRARAHTMLARAMIQEHTFTKDASTINSKCFWGLA